MTSAQKDWYNKDRVAIKGSVVLNNWNKTASPTALRKHAETKAPFEKLNKRELAAARLDRLTASWTTSNVSLNADLYRNLDTIRARANDLARNNPYAKRYLQMVVANVIGGDGVRLQSRIYNTPDEPDTLANNAVELAFSTWGKKGVCDVTGRLSWRDLEAQVTENVARDGEALIRKVRGKTAGNAFGYALQILDVNRLDTSLMRAPEQGRGRVIMGVEVNDFFKPTHYWLKEKNPAEMYMTGASNTNLHLRIPADEIIHIFKQEYPEQVRGLPWMHAGMTLLNHLGAYQEAALVAARVGAAKMGFFTTPDGDPAPLQDGTSDGYEDNIPYTEADPGTFGVLPEGVSFESFNPDYPHQMFGEFIKACLRGVASSWNVAYHSLGNDLEGVNFSSIRSGTLEERDQWMSTQQWLIDSFHEQVFGEWLQSALAFGQVLLTNSSALPLSNIKKFAAHTWQPRRWQWVDPYKDMQTAVLAIQQRLKSPQQVCAELGMDYEDVLVQIKSSEELAAKFGLQPLKPANPDNTTVQVDTTE